LNGEVQLISDGDGLAVVGEAGAVERFLASEGLPSRDLGLRRLGPALRNAAGIALATSEVTAHSGRWVKLTEESARNLEKYSLMKGSTPGVSRAVFTDKSGITGLMEIVKPGAIPANPAFLAGAAGLMAQLAMQQAMDEITDYLATIDEKLDDVLRSQKDAVLADMIGVDSVIEEAMVIRDQVGRVSEVTWSKVQGTSMTVARTQAYALRQLDGLAEKLERKNKLGDIADAAKEAESKVGEWLAVLARCFQLQDALAVLELDRVLDSSPDELDQHRVALRAARVNRVDLIARTTSNLIARMDAAAGKANAKVLLHPTLTRSVVHSGNHVAGAVVDFHGRLGRQASRQALEARRWTVAATEARDKVLETGAGGVDAARAFGSDTLDRARSARSKISNEFAERALRRRGGEAQAVDEPRSLDD
jgi:hypothetical protein